MVSALFPILDTGGLRGTFKSCFVGNSCTTLAFISVSNCHIMHAPPCKLPAEPRKGLPPFFCAAEERGHRRFKTYKKCRIDCSAC